MKRRRSPSVSVSGSAALIVFGGDVVEDVFKVVDFENVGVAFAEWDEVAGVAGGEGWIEGSEGSGSRGCGFRMVADFVSGRLSVRSMLRPKAGVVWNFAGVLLTRTSSMLVVETGSSIFSGAGWAREKLYVDVFLLRVKAREKSGVWIVAWSHVVGKLGANVTRLLV